MGKNSSDKETLNAKSRRHVLFQEETRKLMVQVEWMRDTVVGKEIGEVE